MLSRGTKITDEYSRSEDPKTGAIVHRLTHSVGGNHGLFFLTPSIRPGRSGQVTFVTHRAHIPQICLFDFSNKAATVLTDEPDIHPFSPAFSADGKCIYFSTRQGVIGSVEPESLDVKEHARLEQAAMGECAPSRDGRWIVIAYKRQQRHGLLLLDLMSGTNEILFEGHMKILHPQFHPLDSDIIIFAGDPAPRLWMIRRGEKKPTCLYKNDTDEFIVHESFLNKSNDLIFAIWPYRLARMNLYERKIRTIAEINAWHMVSDPSGRVIVADTTRPDRGLLLIDPSTGLYETLCYPDASCKGSQWDEDHPAGPEVWAALRDQSGEDLSWMEMKTDEVYGPQSTHPHPSFDHTGKQVSFTSDRSNSPEVYVVEAEPYIERLEARKQEQFDSLPKSSS